MILKNKNLIITIFLYCFLIKLVLSGVKYQVFRKKTVGIEFTRLYFIQSFKNVYLTTCLMSCSDDTKCYTTSYDILTSDCILFNNTISLISNDTLVLNTSILYRKSGL